jgi:hypothetical protein
MGCHNEAVQDAFVYVLFGVVIVGVIGALASFFMSGKAYEEIGRGGLFDDPDQMRATHSGGGGFSLAERDAEVREMLESRNRRRVARGQEALDVEGELSRLTAQAMDDTMIAEIREHVEARSARRVRRGHPPLDIEAEVARRVQDLT